MGDFLKFKKMITPIIIQILFWIGVVAAIIMGIIEMVAGSILIVGGTNAYYRGGMEVFMGLGTMFIGPILVRIYCELFIVIFSINDTLTETKNLLKQRAQ